MKSYALVSQRYKAKSSVPQKFLFFIVGDKLFLHNIFIFNLKDSNLWKMGLAALITGLFFFFVHFCDGTREGRPDHTQLYPTTDNDKYNLDGPRLNERTNGPFPSLSNYHLHPKKSSIPLHLIKAVNQINGPKPIQPPVRSHAAPISHLYPQSTCNEQMDILTPGFQSKGHYELDQFSLVLY